MKIVFMGTPEYAAAALEALIGAGHEVLAAVTQPDKARGRSKTLLPPPVKVCALEHGIPVLQPRRGNRRQWKNCGSIRRIFMLWRHSDRFCPRRYWIFRPAAV